MVRTNIAANIQNKQSGVYLISVAIDVFAILLLLSERLTEKVFRICTCNIVVSGDQLLLL